MTSIHEREKSRLQHGVVWPLTLETRKWPVSSSRTLGVWPQFFFSFWHSECDLSKVVCTVFSHSKFFFLTLGGWPLQGRLHSVFTQQKRPGHWGLWRLRIFVRSTSQVCACLEGFLTSFPPPWFCRYDLAITRLFGGFSDEFFEAYHNVLPQAEGCVCVWERERESVCVYETFFSEAYHNVLPQAQGWGSSLSANGNIYICIYVCVLCVYVCVCVCVFKNSVYVRYARYSRYSRTYALNLLTNLSLLNLLTNPRTTR